jgi:ferredoxin
VKESKMNKNLCCISFPGTDYQSIVLEKNQPLSENLTIQNSPVLFGCRTGICGTCLVLIKGEIPPANQDEKEVLEILAPGNQQARLACQIDLTNDVEIQTCEADK